MGLLGEAASSHVNTWLADKTAKSKSSSCALRHPATGEAAPVGDRYNREPIPDEDWWLRGNNRSKVREMLDMYQFPGDDTPFIKGSALKALNGDTGDYGVPAIKQLMEAVDSHFPDPARDVDKPFLMGIESVMAITGKGTVATGRIERGIAKTGDTIEIVGVKDKPMKATIAGIEMFHKTLDEGQSGDQCGVMLKGVKRNEIQRGQVLCASGTVKTYSKFDADIYVLKEDEGGRKKPFFSSYRPQAFIRTATVTVEVQLPDSVEMAMPGDSLSISLNTEKPMALEEGLRFALREGGLTVGSGIITKCH